MKLKWSVYIVLLYAAVLPAQQLKVLTASIEPLEFSKQGEKEFNDNWKAYEAISEKMQNGIDYDDLSIQDKEALDKVSEVHSDYWQVGTDGCSWYCGASVAQVAASSYLSSQGNTTYSPKNAHDFDYKSAWVEGVSGYGIGEYITYSFPQENPRITTISIVNGYVKSEKAWRANSRVKKIKMYLDDEPYAILMMEDKRAAHHFTVPPIGNGDRHNYDELSKLPDWTLKFEILEVYPGEKYEDTVISEIYFDGIDVHCFAAGTKITMADTTKKNIEELRIGDEILSYNTSTTTYSTSVIKELANPVHDQLITITFDDQSHITCTTDHPLLTSKGSWVSYHPAKTMRDYDYDTVELLEVGTILLGENQSKRITSIAKDINEQLTYTIVELDNGTNFIANGIIVGTEPIRAVTYCKHHPLEIKELD
ncbi:hypothetical protein GCM10009430_24310 [Aquimarina litoralis]|uniref:Hint domain-containing protein n=1 Tax=Aquimarina litoralis TaxID=584605 RepID=A0ABP3U4H8_9FLAO